MKETKVYVDDELLIYDDFSLCCTKNFDNTFYTNNYSLIDNEEYFEAYFQSIKSHDRELVKKVCGKISIELENETETYCEIRQCNSPHYQGDYVWFNYVKFRKFIEQIQKEYEK